MKNTLKISGMALLLAFGPVAGYKVFAQGGGKLDNSVFEVEKSKVLVLPEASRNYEKFRIDPPEKKTNAVTYRFNDYKLPDQEAETTFIIHHNSGLKIKINKNLQRVKLYIRNWRKLSVLSETGQNSCK